MKRMFGILTVLGLLALAALPAVGQGAGYLGSLRLKQPVSAGISAADTDVAIVLKYVGTGTYASVAVESNSDLTFTVEGAADTSFECPVSGAAGGIIDVSDAACNTVGEVIDAINSSTNKSWVAFALDAVRTDSSNGTFLASAASDAKLTAGYKVKFDTSTAFLVSRALVACRDFNCYVPSNAKLPDYPYLGTISSIKFFNSANTYGSGTSTINILSVKPGVKHQTETVNTIYSVASAATTVALVKDASTFGSDGLLTDKDSKLIFRITNSLDLTAVTATVYGLLFTY